MPVKKLPPELVTRLRKFVKRQQGKPKPSTLRWTSRVRRWAKRTVENPEEEDIYRLFGRLKNIDHRQERAREELKRIPSNDSFSWGKRVRQMNVSRNYPDIELVLKRTHGFNSRNTITHIKKRLKGTTRNMAQLNILTNCFNQTPMQ
ncbi:hypothetical protein KKE06_04850 [Candidatus Micrarchaeota archaeon]|nr:hypothetical protein [Candidatus Micrarchaeota archaeon]MBU1931044.1 hypothetical protein [Candidatus Micrarchaeota archaeon]